MSRTCQITGKQPQNGHKISHANNKTRRTFLPNLKKRRIWIPSENRYITLKLSTQGLRTIDKLGIEAVLEKLKKAKTN